LPEILIGVSVLAIAIITATNLIVGITRSNRANMDDLTAYYLASEAIEAVRSVRDTQWMNNLKWTGDASYNFWSRGTGIDFEQGGTYIVSRKAGTQAFASADALTALRSSAPWQISKIKAVEKDSPVTKLHLFKVANLKQFLHLSHTTLGDSLDSKFSRYVSIELVDKAMEVKSTVKWSDKGNERNVTLSTVLTDWKSGPN